MGEDQAHSEATEADDLLDYLTTLTEKMLETPDPLGLAHQIVQQTAAVQKADIVTLFDVDETQSFLTLQAGYDKGGQRFDPQAGRRYDLNWDAKTEADVKGQGLTAWVAVSGEELYVPSYQDLTKHEAHGGLWDETVYPNGPGDRNTGFACMYAVPLRTSRRVPPRDSVTGVFKIERRRPAQPLTVQDRRLFRLVAANITLVLQLSDTALRQVLTQAAHKTRGRAGDVLSIIELCQEWLKEDMVDRAIQKLAVAGDLAKGVYDELSRVLNAYRRRGDVDERTACRLVASLVTGYQETYRHDIHVICSEEFHLGFTRWRTLQLEDLLANMVDNALRWSQAREPVRVTVALEQSPLAGVFTVADKGVGMRPELVDRARSERRQYSRSTEAGGTGLRLIFAIAEDQGWTVEYQTAPDKGTTFVVTVPLQRMEEGEQCQ